MAARVSQRRWSRALRRVAAAERSSPVLPTPGRGRDWHIARTTAWAEDTDLSDLPAGVRPVAEPDDSVRSKVAAALVRVGKLDTEREVRLRAFYPEAGVTLRLQAGGQPNGVDRTLHAYALVHEHAPGLMPAVLHDGTVGLGRARFLVEQTLEGSHPRKGKALHEIAESLAAAMHVLHAGVGISERRFSEVVHRKLPQRWNAFADERDLSPALRQAVDELIGRDALLEVSIGHGDLVGSNIMVVEGKVVLIDWEYSRMTPIAFDLAKVNLNCDRPLAASKAMQRGLNHTVGRTPGGYTFNEQLALAHVQMLSWSKPREAKARAADREHALERTVKRRLQVLPRLLGVS